MTRRGNSKYSYYLRQSQWEEDFRDCCERGDLVGLQSWVEEFLQPIPIEEIRKLHLRPNEQPPTENIEQNIEEKSRDGVEVVTMEPIETCWCPLPLIDEAVKGKLRLSYPVDAFDQSSVPIEYEWMTRAPQFSLILPIHPHLPINVNAARAEDGRTGLILAGMNGHLPVVKYLVEVVGVEVNIQDADGNTAMSLAYLRNRYAVVYYLVQSVKSDVNIQNHQDGLTGVMLSMLLGNLPSLKYLVKTAKANVNLKNRIGKTALMMAAEVGFYDGVEYLIENCTVDVDARDVYGCTALLWAVHQGHFRIVRYLVEYGYANVNVRTSESGTTGLIEAAKQGNLDIIEYLIERGGAIVKLRHEDVQPDYAAIIREMEKGKLLEYLIQTAEINLNLPPLKIPNKDEQMTIEITNIKQVREYVKKLFTFWTFVNREDYKPILSDWSKEKILCLAALMKQHRLIHYMVSRKNGDINKTIYFGYTPLMYAICGEHSETVKYIVLNKQANVHLASMDGTTALHMAASKGFDGMVSVLINFGGAQVNRTNENGYTAIMRAAMGNHLSTIKLLAERFHANLHVQNKNGQSIFMIALCKCSLEIVKYLFQYVHLSEEGQLQVILAAITRNDVSIVRYLIESGIVGIQCVLQNQKQLFAFKIKAKSEVEAYICHLIDFVYGSYYPHKNSMDSIVAEARRYWNRHEILMMSAVLGLSHLFEKLASHEDMNLFLADYRTQKCAISWESVLVDRHIVQRLLSTGAEPFVNPITYAPIKPLQPLFAKLFDANLIRYNAPCVDQTPPGPAYPNPDVEDGIEVTDEEALFRPSMGIGDELLHQTTPFAASSLVMSVEMGTIEGLIYAKIRENVSKNNRGMLVKLEQEMRLRRRASTSHAAQAIIAATLPPRFQPLCKALPPLPPKIEELIVKAHAHATGSTANANVVTSLTHITEGAKTSGGAVGPGGAVVS